MSKTEIKARTGEDLSPVQEVTQAINGFISDFKGFQGEIEMKLQQTEERLIMLDRKQMTSARTPLAGAVDTGAPHQKAFNAYLRSGDDDGLRGLEIEVKSLSTAVNSDGGYLVDPQTANTVKSVLNATASVRSIASVVNVEATTFDVLVDHTDVGAGWATESGSVSETDTPQIDRMVWTSPRGSWRIRRLRTQAGRGATLVMRRRASTGLSRRMRSLVWFMRWGRNTAPVQAL